MSSTYQIKAWLPCDTCKVPTNRRHRKSGNMQCLRCGVERMKDALKEISAKDGPAYVDWMEKTLVAIERGNRAPPPPVIEIHPNGQ